MKVNRFALVGLLFPCLVGAQEPSLGDFLRGAWEKSPVLRAEDLQNESADAFISAARGKYLPHFSLNAIDSSGFAASNSTLGVIGIAGSPYRKGWAGDLNVTQTVYDFGRIASTLLQAKASKGVEEARLAGEKYSYLVQAGQVYLACARARAQVEADKGLMNWAQLNLKETARFTRSGQRSVVDNALVQTEVDKLNLDISQLQKYQRSLLEQMKMYLGTPGCKIISDSINGELPANLKVDDPTLLFAKSDIDLSNAQYQGAKSAQLPTINIQASAGQMEEARLVDQQNWAAGVGLEFPIWNGGEDARREHAYKAQSESLRENLKAVQMQFDIRIKNLRDRYNRSTETLGDLIKDLHQVENTIKLASKRYRNLEGPLIDVREAFAQLKSMEFQRIELETTLASDALELGLLKLK